MKGRVSVKLTAARGATVEITFEPIGTSFEVSDGDWVRLELPADAASSLEFVAWPNGIGVWVPYPGDYIVYDANGNELDRL